MKVDRKARREVDEYFALKSEDDVEQDRLAEETAEQCEITENYEHERERQEARDEIDTEARQKYWSADQWLEAMKGTYLFSDEELMPEFEQRRQDDDWGWDWHSDDYREFLDISML